MGINIADNFQYLSQKPLDGRTKYDTTAAMKAVSDSSMYDGCMAYCSGTDKTYQWKSSNSVDATLGRWREFATGGTDSNAYHTSDATGSAIVDDDYFPFYDTSVSTKKKSTWSNIKSLLKTYFDTLYNKYTLPTATSSVLGGVKIGENMLIEDGVINPSYLVVANKFNKSDIYSTTEKVVGCWTDGRPIYQRTYTGTLAKTTAIGTEVTTTISIGASVREFIDFQGYYSNSVYGATSHIINNARWTDGKLEVVRAALDDNATSGNTNVIRLLNSWYTSDSIYTVTIRYTKATDAANSFNYADENDYSTSEQIIGKWVDGSNLFQKTISFGTLPNATSKTVAHGISNLKRIIEVSGYAYRSSSTAFIPLPFSGTNTSANANVNITCDATNILVTTLTDRSTFTESYITIKYTKTK